jgi:hypothetical protein
LVERIAARRVNPPDAELRYAWNKVKRNLRIGHYQRRSAARRFLAAVEVLARVRKLARHAVQINVAGKLFSAVPSEKTAVYSSPDRADLVVRGKDGQEECLQTDHRFAAESAYFCSTSSSISAESMRIVPVA